MKISVIISTYSKANLSKVKECLESLKKQIQLPHEILLILDEDQGLFDFYEKEIQGVKIHSSGGKGLSRARNFGVNQSEGNIVAFIDDDAVAEKDWLKIMNDNFQEKNLAGVGGKIIPNWEKNRPIWFPEEIDWIVGCTYKGMPEKRQYIRNPIGCNMAFNKETIKKAGLFNEEIGRIGKVLLGSEEAELSIRVLEKNPELKIVYDPEMKVKHKVPNSRVSIKYIIRRSFFEGYSKAFLTKINKNYDKAFSTENQYIQFLLTKSLPQRLLTIYKKSSIMQILTLIIVILAVGSGYIYEKIQ